MAKESFFSVRGILQDRRKLSIFLICLGVSIFMWLLTSLGKEYNTTVLIPVEYINFPENKTLLNEVPDKLAVSVAGSGYELIRHNQGLLDDTLIIDLDELTFNMLGDYQRGSLNPAALSKDLQKKLKVELAITSVLSDSLKFVFDLKVARIKKVKPIVRFSVAKGYIQVDSVKVIPEEVEVYGALSVLDTLSFVKTSPIELGELQKSVVLNTELSIEDIGKDASLSVKEVAVEIVLDELAEKRFMIEPTVVNLPDSLVMFTFPSAVEVIGQMPIGIYDDVEASGFLVEVDYLKLESGYMVLPVELQSWPSRLAKVQLQPDQVEIVITPKE